MGLAHGPRPRAEPGPAQARDLKAWPGLEISPEHRYFLLKKFASVTGLQLFFRQCDGPEFFSPVCQFASVTYIVIRQCDAAPS